MNRSTEYKYSFTLICACYNVGKWIQNFLDSLSRQTVNFEEHVQLILVDDGSTDGTAALAKAFVARYPKNALYLYKENGGASSARNHGLPHAEGEWINFADPDDFLDAGYFENIIKFIERTSFNGNIFACNTIQFYEKEKKFVNDHPLHFKFSDGDAIIDLNEHSHYIHLFTNTAFIRHDLFKKSKLVFDLKVRPLFEDGHLLGLLLLFSNDYRMGFLKSAIYCYRKRATEDGLVASSWYKPEQYTDRLLYGYLHLAQYAKQACGKVPEFIQNVIVYDIRVYVGRFLDNQIPYRFSQAEFKRFLDLMRLIFSYIDPKNILFSKLPMLPLRIGLAMLYAFQKINLTETPFFVQEIAPDTNSIQILHYSGEECALAFSSAGKNITPLWQKTVRRRYLGTQFCVEQIVWLPFAADTTIKCHADGVPVQILAGTSCYDEIRKPEILGSFYLPESALPHNALAGKNMAASPSARAKFADCWLLADRPHKADDNAEHLYRWLMRKPGFTKKIYFVLDPGSADWGRLAQEGFKLLTYGGEEHTLALWNAEWVMSSHTNKAVQDPIGFRNLTGSPAYKFAFLQHGVIINDLSGWLNNERLDLFVAGTQREYDSLTSDPYKFCAREVALTGLPRHDRLLEKARACPKTKNIILCPTWRWHLRFSEAFSGAPSREEVNRYLASDYFAGWNKLLSSPRLAEIAEDNKIKLLLLPHPEVERFIDHYAAIPEVQRIAYKNIKSIQDIILRGSMLVTDYSSLSMDFGLIGRPVFYYQFPEKPRFFDGPLIRPGYFTYEENGFGPVLDNHEALVESIRLCLERGATREEIYEQRAQNFFTLRDGQNCSRVFEAIMHRS